MGNARIDADRDPYGSGGRCRICMEGGASQLISPAGEFREPTVVQIDSGLFRWIG